MFSAKEPLGITGAQTPYMTYLASLLSSKLLIKSETAVQKYFGAV